MHDFDRGLNPIGEEFHSAWTPRTQASIVNHVSATEIRLLEWVIEARRAGINVTRNMIRAQAARFAIEAQTHSPLDPRLSPILELPSGANHQDAHEATPIFTSGTQNPTSFPYQASTVGPHITNSDIDLLAANLYDSILAHEDQWTLDSSTLAPTTSSFATTRDEDLFSTLGQTNTSNPSFSNGALGLCQTHSTTTCAHVNPDKMGSICPPDVRYAFSIVESYISDSLAKTALDQLCLNHIKAILDK